MPKTISYTNTPTVRFVKPTQTRFTNNTDKSIALQFISGDEDVGVDETTNKISKKIISIKCGATVYYSSDGDDYTIPANKTVTLTKTNQTIDMNIP